ncbi:MAG: tRNA (N(6)-L-threonylcarbamoyladenosine(37)-C(2))-methylthiotransferase MtaB [Clostridiales bacterium]|nr:tRNA (N(6)-L-threonylcarbamoyladenosine(37)-C(2))-methylthiotransferase MtaB [Clostridiales bacterium]
MMIPKTFYVYNFGCKVNQEEGEGISALLSGSGWRKAAKGEAARLYIVNACAVTQTAEKKARALLRRLRREHPAALIVITGCLAQVAAAELAKLNVANIIVGFNERADLAELVELRLQKSETVIKVSDIGNTSCFMPLAPLSKQQRARAYLKIEDGCDQSCHYCIIPKARGPVRSLALNKAVEGARQLILAGHQELVLTGIHIGAYGEDLPAGEDLLQLLEKILQIPGSFRLRLGSLEPQHFTEPLLALWAKEERICPHLHIPLQSASNKILEAMNRSYSKQDYAALRDKLRTLRPGAAITTDVMVGYPGESNSDLAETHKFCQKMAFARMHVFPYSPRPGTVAAGLPDQILPQEKKRRAALLGSLAASLAEDYAQSYVGAQLEYLYEREIEFAGQPYYCGRSANYLQLLLSASTAPPSGFVAVTAKQYRHGYLICE